MIKNIIMTGATGFVGSHFLLNLLGTEIEHAFVIIRGADHEIRQSKLIRALSSAAKSYMANPSIDECLSRITIVEGDIEKSFCGLNSDDLNKVTDAKVHSFFHFAASLAFEESARDSVMAQNVAGTIEAIALAKRIGKPHYFYVSTAYSCGLKETTVPEGLHDLNRIFSNVYEESKCKAEHIVTDTCKEHEIPLTILRPSIVIGNSQTKKTGGSNTGLYGFMREYKKLKRAVSSTNDIVRIFGKKNIAPNLVPVDFVIEDIREILKKPLVDGQIFHLCSSENVSMKTVSDLIAEVLGIQNVHLAEREDGDNDLSPLENLLAKRTGIYSSYISTQKNFQRQLKRKYKMDVEDYRGFVIEAVKEMERGGLRELFTRKIITASDGCSLNGYFTGNPENPPLVLINAHSMPVEFLYPLAEKLRNDFYVMTWETRLLPSLMGNDADMECGIPRLLEDFKEVMESFGVASCDVIGWCTGARLAVEAARTYPALVKKMALLNGEFVLENVEKTPFEENLHRLMPKVSESRKYAKLIHASIYMRKSSAEQAEETEDARTQTDTILSSTDPDLVHLTSMPFHNVESLYRYGNLITAFRSVPFDEHRQMPNHECLVVTSSLDVTSNPLGSKKMADALKNATYYNHVGGDHFSLYTDEKYINKVINYFVQVSSKEKQNGLVEKVELVS